MDIKQKIALFPHSPGVYRYYDAEGNLQAGMHHWAGHWQLPAADNCSCSLLTQQKNMPTALPVGDGIHLRTELLLQGQTGTLQKIPMLTGLETGEMIAADPRRPSLILRRGEGLSLWELAKTSGSTMAAIQQANGLTGQPEPEQMLLIPVL